VASRRCVQNCHEEGIRQNPDDFVKHLLSEEEIGQALKELEGLRAWSFYHYLLARTRHYDQVFREALNQSVRQIVLFGSGWDTRAYRFSGLLRERGISVLETDLPVAIREKEARVRSLGNYEYVRFLPLDLKVVDYGVWLEQAELDCSARTLFLAEGVTEYLDIPSIKRWLLFMSRRFVDSIVAYDGRVTRKSDRIVRLVMKKAPFTLPASRSAVERFHRALGLQTVAVYNSPELQSRHLQYADTEAYDHQVIVVLKRFR
jgi:methyltransferase (TIGR00027 family)